METLCNTSASLLRKPSGVSLLPFATGLYPATLLPAHSCPINYGLLSDGLQRLAAQVEHVVVEGTGGWRSLMNDLRPLSEWVVQEQLPVLMVVGIQEGCINHALLTAQAIAVDKAARRSAAPAAFC